jgi:hypothetical protein
MGVRGGRSRVVASVKGGAWRKLHLAFERHRRRRVLVLNRSSACCESLSGAQ